MGDIVAIIPDLLVEICLDSEPLVQKAMLIEPVTGGSTRERC